MLHTARLKPSYWEFAMLNACYLNNRTWHHNFEGVPVTLATGHVPNLGHLKIFGCPAFVHIPGGQRRKMSDTAFERGMLGIDDTKGLWITGKLLELPLELACCLHNSLSSLLVGC